MFEKHYVWFLHLRLFIKLSLIMALECIALLLCSGWLKNYYSICPVLSIILFGAGMMYVYVNEKGYADRLLWQEQDRKLHLWINAVPLLLSILDVCSTVIYLWVIKDSLAIYLLLLSKLMIFCTFCAYVIIRQIGMKKIVRFTYEPKENCDLPGVIGFGDIIIVSADGTVHVLDETKETIEFGYRNEVLLLRDVGFQVIPLDKLRAILLINGRDFNKAVIPVNGSTFTVKDLSGYSQFSDYSLRTDTEILRFLSGNSI